MGRDRAQVSRRARWITFGALAVSAGAVAVAVVAGSAFGASTDAKVSYQKATGTLTVTAGSGAANSYEVFSAWPLDAAGEPIRSESRLVISESGWDDDTGTPIGIPRSALSVLPAGTCTTDSVAVDDGDGKFTVFDAAAPTDAYVEFFSCSYTEVRKLVVNAGDNDDFVAVSSSSIGEGQSVPATLAVEIQGGGGNDDLTGGDGNDTIDGGADDDIIEGGAGDDTLYGRGGIDIMAGDEGADSLSGGDGDDSLYAMDRVADHAIDCGGGQDDYVRLDAVDPSPTGCERTLLFGETRFGVDAQGVLTVTMTGTSDLRIVRKDLDVVQIDEAKALSWPPPAPTTMVAGAGCTNTGIGAASCVGVTSVVVHDSGQGNAIEVLGLPATVNANGGDDRIAVDDGFVTSVECGAGTDRVVRDVVDAVAASCESVALTSKTQVRVDRGTLVAQRAGLSGWLEFESWYSAGSVRVSDAAGTMPGAGCYVSDWAGVSCAGVSRIDATGGALADRISTTATVPATLRGGDGDDRLTGGPGRDVLLGDAGSDQIVADDFEADVIVCGDGTDAAAGTDTAVVDVKDVVNGCKATVTQFVTVGVVNGVLEVRGPTAESIAVQIEPGLREETVVRTSVKPKLGRDCYAFSYVYEFTSVCWGATSIDVTGGDRYDYIWNSTSVPATLRGGAAIDTISGGAGDDTVDGGEGDDRIYTYGGNDVVSGGAGDDLIYTDGGNDAVSGGVGVDTVFTGDGDDRVEARDGEAEASVDCGTGVSDVAVLDTADVASGCETEDRPPVDPGITATVGVDGGVLRFAVDDDAANRVAIAPAGTGVVWVRDDALDVLLAGAGCLSVGGDPKSAECSGVTRVEVDTGALDDTVSVTGAWPATVNGGAGNDALTGGGGNDTLTGGDGADTLIGGGGVDVFAAGAGADRVEARDDVAEPAVDCGVDGVDVAVVDYADGTSGCESEDRSPRPDPGITATVTVAGGVFRFTVDDDAANRVTIVPAGAGVVRVRDDALDVLLVGAGCVSVAGDPKAADCAGVSRGEVGTGARDDTVTVTAAVPVTVDGGAGNDILAGGAAADVLNGGDGDDTLTGNAGGDDLNGGAGTDTVLMTSSDGAHGVVVTLDDRANDGTDVDGLPKSVKRRTAEEKDNVRGSVEVVRGTAFADVMVGAAGSQRFEGLGGDDSLYGLDGDDTLDGGAGNDVVDGGNGNDILTGGAGVDQLFGGAGNDTLEARDGVKDKTLSCSTGVDTVRADGVPAGTTGIVDPKGAGCETTDRAVFTAPRTRTS